MANALYLPLLLVLCTCTIHLQGRHLISELNLGPDNSELLQTSSSDLGSSTRVLHVQEVEAELRRMKRQARNVPIIHGDHQFGDGNNYASIHYSGSSSPVILVLTFRYSQQLGFLGGSNLYRSTDYGATFTPIEQQLDSADRNPSLWLRFYVSPINRNMIVFQHVTLPKIYYSNDEGATWNVRLFTPSTLNPRSLLWNPVNDHMILAHDSTHDQLYVTQDLGRTWTKIADYVDYPSDYQWGDPSFDTDPSLVYYNTYDPNDHNRLNTTVSLFTQRSPYTSATRHELDPNLGKHDDFLLLGPYIFAQKTDAQNVIHLYLSYKRQPFQKALIPSTDLHQRYIVSHIDLQQALVIVEHVSGQYNLYLSDITGVYFSLSLPDIVNDNNRFDLELIEGVNGTLVANQYVRTSPTQPKRTVRTLVSLDNGGNWEFVRPPASAQCSPPQCSLHFHMTTSAYARTGVYSQASAPGLIVAHGNTGRTLNANNPDLYISRDGGVSWALTLQGSWGVSVLDHGGLLVVAKDYHNVPSRELRYSCNEGRSWTSFNFSSVPMTVYGVLTEPGEYTTTISLYGLKQRTNTWDVVTVNFSSTFLRTCSPSDFYDWHPWDDRTDSDCILGSAVTIERRNASICCLIGQDYSRPTHVASCLCSVDDFECDYGYKRADGFTGSCIRDSIVQLPPGGCVHGHTNYSQSQGYRKVAGDLCSGGLETLFGPVLHPCDTGHCVSECVASLSTCQLTILGYVCVCVAGYTGDGTVSGSGCTDIDECATGLCSPMASCTNSPGSFQCTCNPGYTGDGLHCYNVNECLDTPGPCASNAVCTDSEGSFSCSCQPGYSGNGYQNCSNINECRSSPCDVNAVCTDLPGGFNCTCNHGFIGTGTACFNNQNPCSEGCVSNAMCVYSDRGYRCLCDHGFTGDGMLGGGSGCSALANGCSTSSPCAYGATCSISNGTYSCHCGPGFSGDGYSSCTNINECASSPCVSNAECSDSDGSFSCICVRGYIGDGLASGGTGCTSIQTQPSSNTTTIVIGVLLALVACFAFLFGVLALCYIVKFKELKKNHYRSHGSAVGGGEMPQAEGVRFSNLPVEERPLTWTHKEDDDDDDEPLLT